MRPQVIIITLAVLGILAAVPLGKVAKGEEDDAGASSSWPCCDNCGACNRKQPPECHCKDVSVQGCHPECKNCVKLAAAIPPGHGLGPVVTYSCADMLTNFCQRNCTQAVAAPPLGGGV